RKPKAAKLFLAELLLGRDRARDVVAAVLGGIDPRRDDERLLAAANREPHALPDFGELIRRAQVGNDLLPSGRHLVDQGDVEVAVDGLVQGLRDRRGGREKKVGVGAYSFLAEGRALTNAEAVLLVDDRQTQSPERDVFLDQRVG